MKNIESATWPHVLEFAERMEKKLDQNRHKGDREGWLNDGEQDLMDRLIEELDEVIDAFENGADPETIADELADVANFCMMVADKVRTTYGSAQ